MIWERATGYLDIFGGLDQFFFAPYMLFCQLRESFEYKYVMLCLCLPGNSSALLSECPSLKADGYHLPPIAGKFGSALASLI